MDLIQFKEKFEDEKACCEWLVVKRWGSIKPACVYCNERTTYSSQNGTTYKCSSHKCGKYFTVRIGTIFERSRLPLTKWFLVIYLLTTTEKRLSSYKIAEVLDVTQRTGCLILQRLKDISNNNNPFLDTAEIDKSYFDKKKDKVNNNKI